MGDLVQRYRGYIIEALVFVIVFGIYAFVSRLPEPEAIEIIPPTPTATFDNAQVICVHVAGAVPYPGLYDLAPESRWGDAIEAAGGMRVDAVPSGVNLAQKLSDGQQVYVPMEGIPVPATPTMVLRTSGAESNSSALVNINTAQADELVSLPGIGPAYAERIILYREDNGGFESVADIINVKGIGPSCFERIESRICVE